MIPKIKLIGKEGKNWSVDKDRYYTEKALKDLQLPLVNSFLTADIIYSVWYYYLFRKKFFFLPLLKKKIIAVVTNDIKNANINFDKYKKTIKYWIYANSEQKNFLLKNEISEQKIFFNPYYVDETVFYKLEKSKEEISKTLNLDFNLIKNKIVIGSFQRDSLGKDLSKPKIQKNPEVIINMLKRINPEKYIFLLAGPRRHYIVNACKKFNIPYIFSGNENYINKMKDDIFVNNLSVNIINKLYNITDLYLITSSSEGGPKAVLETALTKTPVLSTPAGFAPDFLSEASICNKEDIFFEKLEAFIKLPESANKSVLTNYENVSRINNYKAFKMRLKNIIETVINDN